MKKKIALLFITRSDLTHSALWKEWLDLEKYTVYSHSKDPVNDPWFSQFRITENLPNEWGHILLVEQALFKEALKNKSNYKFVILSESCVPLRSCEEIHQFLTRDDSSYMKWKNAWWSRAERTQWDFPKEHRRFGNHSWYILNRKHAQMIAEDTRWIERANAVEISDESYPVNFFSYSGVLNEFKNVLTTYVDWERGSPQQFSVITNEDVERLLHARHFSDGPEAPRHCLFGRKFHPSFPDEMIKFIQKGGMP